MRTTIIILLLCLGVGLAAQADEPKISPLGYEFNSWIILPEITGDNTEAEANFSWGVSLAGVAQFDLNQNLILETGVQLGMNNLTQTVTERNTFPQGTNEILRIVEVEAHSFHVGVPVFVKVFAGTSGAYLKIGARGLFNFSPSSSARLVGPASFPDGEGPIHPPGDVDTPAFNAVLEAGLGYRFFGRNGRASYIELNFGRPMSPVIEHAGPRDAIGRLNYLDTTTAYNLGLTLGTRFGR